MELRLVRYALGHRCCVLLLAALLAGCASLPSRDVQPASHALRETGGTALADLAVRSVPAGQNGFRLLSEPADALDVRLALIDQAQRTLDLQYFIWNADGSGRTMLAAVRDAALRGVRVRLLLDDLYTTDLEALLEGLTGFDGVEVRLFNPFPAGRGSLAGRIVASVGDYRRIRHRMHNKLLVADNIAAITGGRNIGDRYLAAGQSSFFDTDILAIGPVVRDMSGSFDHYWNSEHAFPGALFWGDSPAAARRARFADAIGPMPPVSRHPDMGGASAMDSSAARQIAGGSVSLQVCKARLFFDTTDKVLGANLADSTGTVHHRVVDVLAMAQHDLYVASPYFVRGRVGLARIEGLRNRGVRLRLLTNSASSTDEPLAHAVYLRYRRRLIEAGVDLREFVAPAAPAAEREGSGISASGLHAKLAVIDHRYLYIGSLNFTGRSERINTELGLILDCPALASEVLSLMEAAPAYHLRLKEDGPGVEWVDRRASPPHVQDVEPGTSLWQRVRSSLLGRLVPEGEI
ncbi:phospholipase D-like domain-containing protein [Ramlibacter montanisoli]|uniref:Phospholipase D family protein n=1 Tax=Ramlibacter montanisoli TaxID=2732512 RepID=A0A849K7K0_9BURK|nr:phospholipase D family protein [Ramlibacter montanisoli]NNU42027.1 phospholipase D family protein [Ramlibacter montanisoli]